MRSKAAAHFASWWTTALGQKRNFDGHKKPRTRRGFLVVDEAYSSDVSFDLLFGCDESVSGVRSVEEYPDDIT